METRTFRIFHSTRICRRTRLLVHSGKPICRVYVRVTWAHNSGPPTFPARPSFSTPYSLLLSRSMSSEGSPRNILPECDSWHPARNWKKLIARVFLPVSLALKAVTASALQWLYSGAFIYSVLVTWRLHIDATHPGNHQFFFSKVHGKILFLKNSQTIPKLRIHIRKKCSNIRHKCSKLMTTKMSQNLAMNSHAQLCLTWAYMLELNIMPEFNIMLKLNIMPDLNICPNKE